MMATQIDPRYPIIGPSVRIIIVLLVLCSAGTKADDLAVALQAFDNAQYSDSLRQLEVFTKAHPKNPAALYYLGRSQYHAGDFKAAEKSLEALLKDHPEHIEGHYLMGSIREVVVGSEKFVQRLALHLIIDFPD